MERSLSNNSYGPLLNQYYKNNNTQACQIKSVPTKKCRHLAEILKTKVRQRKIWWLSRNHHRGLIHFHMILHVKCINLIWDALLCHQNFSLWIILVPSWNIDFFSEFDLIHSDRKLFSSEITRVFTVTTSVITADLLDGSPAGHCKITIAL